MNEVPSPIVAPWCESLFAASQKNLNGLRGSSYHSMRQDAYQAFKSLGFPQAHLNEDWKYTSLRELIQTDFTIEGHREETSLSAINPTAFKSDLNEAYHTLCFYNGIYQEDLSTKHELPEGVLLVSLVEALHSQDPHLQQIVKKELGNIADYKNKSLVALNTAFMHDGVILYVPAGVKVERPVHLIFMSHAAKTPTASFPRVYVRLEKGAEVQLIQEFRTDKGEVTFSNSLTECVLGENAKLKNVMLELESIRSYHYSHIAVRQSADSFFHTSSYSFGGKIVRNEISPVLLGENCDTHMYGLSLLDGDQHVDNFTVLDHAKPNCESTELYKGIYDDSSKGVFCGMIIVREDAQKTNAIQSNQGLLLSDKASLSTKPQLKIWADDVKCTHGATIGQIDKDALFYLRSRGVGKNDAMNMLIQAFAGGVTRELALPELRERIERLLERKLSKR